MSKSWLSACALGLGFGVGLAGGMATANAADAMSVHGVTKTEIVLGMHTDLSGVAASYGVSSANAVRMRADEVNEAGGIHGRKIHVIIEDNQYQVPRAVQAVNKLLHRDHIFAMVAPLGTPMNMAVFDDQFKENVPNLFPLSAARQMYLPFNRLKFYGAASYYDEMRSGLKWMVEHKGKKSICMMYQDTDFGKEVYEGMRDQAAAMKIPLVESVTHKPTDQDFTPQITKLRAAKCDLVGMGTIVRDTIIPYSTARKTGWTDVDFLGSAATYDQIVAGVPGGVTEGFYAMGLTEQVYRDTASPTVANWFDRYKAKFNQDPNIGAVYGYVAMDLTVIALDRAGTNLTTDSFIKALESIDGYRDIFGGPTQSYSATKHQGANSSFVAQVKSGRWTRVTDPVIY
ncbi:MAG TPA: ABC transporter substrate-binding protein [Candidatus Cybelea sp.]|nr:ABC transporter substrate-binding protein [Candidatus Cybelea sp.]